MKITRIVIISYVLLTAAITVGIADKKPVNPTTIRAADCCSTCPPICPFPPGQTH